MSFDALIIVDMQVALVGRHPFNEVGVVRTISMLIAACRERGIPVLYVRHDGGMGDELQRGTPGWEICDALAPSPDDVVFDKRFNSAFRQTGLHNYLQDQGFRNLIMCGMQTEYCLDASCKVAFEYGYEVIVPKGGATTFDNDFATGEALTKYYEQEIWHDRYAQVLPLADILALRTHDAGE